MCVSDTNMESLKITLFEIVIIGKIASEVVSNSSRWSIMKINRCPSLVMAVLISWALLWSLFLAFLSILNKNLIKRNLLQVFYDFIRRTIFQDGAMFTRNTKVRSDWKHFWQISCIDNICTQAIDREKSKRTTNNGRSEKKKTYELHTPFHFDNLFTFFYIH
jgi:hypothetical protein